MIKRDELTKFIYSALGEEILQKAASEDSAPNSVQIRGKNEVNKVVLGVSTSLEFIEQAVAEEADYMIVHHGMHTGYIMNGRFEPYEQRLRLIFQNELTLAGFHFALDHHPTLGNNAVIIEKLKADMTDENYLKEWGWVGEFKKPIPVRELADRCSKLFQHDVFAVYAGPEMIKRMGVCSGGARPRVEDLMEILDKKIDLHLTGEISESSPYMAEEIGFNYFAGGHYATEVFGVQALAGEIKKKFGSKLEVEFLDIPSSL